MNTRRLAVLRDTAVAIGAARRAVEVHVAVLAAIRQIFDADRAAVLLFDGAGVLRFEAWNGLSDAYRKTVEGHTPWYAGQPDPAPIVVEDALAEASLVAYRSAFAAEGIAAMLMVPLVAGGGTIGKFMVYFGARRVVADDEISVVQTLAAQTAFALDRLRAVASLEASEALHRTIVARLREVVFRVDRDGRIELLSEAFQAVTGVHPATLLGGPLDAQVHVEDRARFAAALGRLLSGLDDEVELLVRLARPEAHPPSVEVVARTLRDPQGHLLGAIGSMADVTARLEAERAVREADRRLQERQRLEGLGLLAGGIAHDFNNLLVGVLGNAELLADGLVDRPELRELSVDIGTSARRAADLTHQLLAYAGKATLIRQRLVLGELVQESTRILDAAVPVSATVVYRFAATPVLLDGDATQLRQVLINLIMNAVEALGGKRGTIDVRVDTATVGEAELARARHLHDARPGAFAVLEVRDSGVGMDAATQEQLWEPFFTTKFQGRGLGLPVLLSIVRGHGGFVELESTLGQGTSVRVFLPAATGGVPEVASERPAPSTVQGAGRTVLVVDDEPMLLAVAARILRGRGFTVLTAETGMRAVEVLGARDGAVDVVLLDMIMPGWGGNETCREILARWPHLPVVFTSGYSPEAVGVVDPALPFLRKPFRPAELLGAIEAALTPD